MVKKGVAIFLISVIILTFLISFAYYVSAQTTTEEEKVAKAYDWLTKQVKGKWQNLNVKQHVFSVLALRCNESYFSAGNSSLHAKKFSSQNMSCWGIATKPTSPDGCFLVETAMAKIALDSWGDNTTKVTNWLLSRNMTQVQGINWYLQIDVERGSSASCEIIYGGNEERMFEIAADKKVSIVNGTSKCFYVDPSEPYWFRIKPDEGCYSYTYTIKCWSNATTYKASLLYKKTNSATWHVSSETESGRPGVPGSNKLEDQPNPLELEAISYCLSNPVNIGQGCDYEGTAWAAYALATSASTKEREQAKKFVPYLVVFSEDNIRFFPPSFLYPITSSERYSNEILASQKVVGTDKGYWLIQPNVYGRVYDTAHAGLALGTTGGDAITKAKNYLLANQGSDGNLVVAAYGETGKDPIRDTAFALWVFWPGQCPGIGPGAGGNCAEMGPDYVCTSNITCDPDWIEIPDLYCEFGEICCKYVGAGGAECTTAGGSCKDLCGNNENEFEIETVFCPDWKYCCKAYSEAYCNETSGEICDEANGYACQGNEVDTLDGKCCLGSCIPNNTAEQNCIDIGFPCSSDQVCINKITWEVVPFTPTQDENRCCVGTSVKCIQDKLCSSIGEKCSLGEECSGNIVETKDEEECCEGQCLETCSKKGGDYCYAEEQCSGGHFETSSEGPRCCVGGTCKKPTSLWWLWIIIILVILGGGAAYYFLIVKKKPKQPKEKISPFGGPGLFPVSPIVRAPSATTAITTPKPQFPQPRPRPIQAQPKSQPKPTPTMPMMKPMAAMAGTGATARATGATGATPAAKTKSKTENELEKTLSKLKKMTKK